MKKTITIAFSLFLGSIVTNAQDAIQQLECKGYQDAVTKALKDTENPKKNTKSAAWLKLGTSYQDLAMRCYSDSNAADKAYNAFLKAQDVEKAAGGKKMKDVEAAMTSKEIYSSFLQQGVNYYNAKNNTKASKLFGMASSINKKDTLSALYAGISYQALGDNLKASDYFSSYMNGGGKDISVYFAMSQLLKSEKKYAEAIAMLKKASTIYPNDKDLKNEVVNIYLASNNIDGAISDLEKMESNAENLANLGLLYDSKNQDLQQDLNKSKEALEKLNTADIDKKITSENDKLGAFESEIGNLNAKLKKEPKTAAATKKRISEVTAQRDAIQMTIKKLNEDKASRSGNGNVESLKADVIKKEAVLNASVDKTVGTYKKALALQPNNYDVNFNLAVMYFNQAVEIKRVVDAMDIKTFQSEGKAIEQKACAKFNEAKPYFEKCKSIKADEVVDENLKNLNRIIESCK